MGQCPNGGCMAKYYIPTMKWKALGILEWPERTISSICLKVVLSISSALMAICDLHWPNSRGSITGLDTNYFKLFYFRLKSRIQSTVKEIF